MVIPKGPLTDHLPLMQKGDAEVVTQFSMNDVEKLGLLKMDFLGLRNLDVIDGAVKIIEQTRASDFNIEPVPLDDAETYQMLAKGDSNGVFQFESSGMREALRDIQPTRFDDLIALVALYRPGPMEYIPTYARNKRNPAIGHLRGRAAASPSWSPPTAWPSTKSSSWRSPSGSAASRPAQADDLRKAIGKKNHRQMDKLEPSSSRAPPPTATAATVIDHLWSLMEKAGDYSFNKSHAACYALISYRTAYLKANYPVRVHGRPHLQRHGHQGQGAVLRDRANDMGIEVLPPDINESVLDFRGVEGRSASA